MCQRSLGTQVASVVLGGALCAAPAFGEGNPNLDVKLAATGTLAPLHTSPSWNVVGDCEDGTFGWSAVSAPRSQLSTCPMVAACERAVCIHRDALSDPTAHCFERQFACSAPNDTGIQGDSELA